MVMSDTLESYDKKPLGTSPAGRVLGDAIETGIIRFGNIVSFFILIIMLFTTYEVLARYLFNRPTSWVWLINRQLFAIFALVGGSYTMAHGMHIRIEMLLERFNPVMKIVIRCVSLLCLIGFLGVMIWQGATLGWISFGNKEFVPGNFKMPLYPVKLFLPLAAFLFLIEGIVCFFKKKL
jgi:TRAP-type mannitol/chloroaromatic compound transport system permease small subunit